MKLIISPKPGKDGQAYTVDFTINSVTPPYPLSKVVANIGKINNALKLFGGFTIKIEASGK